jgi:hypothetical protein
MIRVGGCLTVSPSRIIDQAYLSYPAISNNLQSRIACGDETERRYICPPAADFAEAVRGHWSSKTARNGPLT